MPDSSNFSTVGSTISNASVGSIGNFSSKGSGGYKQRKFRYRVTNVFFDEKGNCIYVEYEDTFRKFGQSGILKNNSTLVAYTSNANLQIIPEIGEYIEVFKAADEYSAALNSSDPTLRTYWKSTEGSLNIWNTFEGDNINLDPTVPGQVSNTQMASLNTENYNKSLMGMVPKST